MRKREAREDEAIVCANQPSAAEEKQGIEERLQIIEEQLSILRGHLKRLRGKPH
jgi:hypothetical protein